MRLPVLLLAATLAAAPAAAAEPAAPAEPLPEGGWLAAPLGDDGTPAEAAVGSAGPLSPDDVAAVRRVEDYLNGISTLHARFVQVSSEGSYAEGELFVHRPGRLRFEYDPPHPVLMVADGFSLLYYDKELRQATFIPLWETPLWFLVRDKVRLSDRLRVTRVSEDKATVSITLKQGEADSYPGSVTLIFGDEPLRLRKWLVTDAQGITVQVALVDPRFGIEIDSAVFDYSDLDIYKLRGGGTDR